MSEWTPERFLNWAGDIGEATREVVQRILHEKRHQEQNYRRVLVLLSNAKKYGRDRLNKACHRALQIHSPTCSSVESILKRGLDQLPLEQGNTPSIQEEQLNLDYHENVRGEAYYH